MGSFNKRRFRYFSSSSALRFFDLRALRDWNNRALHSRTQLAACSIDRHVAPIHHRQGSALTGAGRLEGLEFVGLGVEAQELFLSRNACRVFKLEAVG